MSENDKTERLSPNYEEIIKNMEDKHKEEVYYHKNRADELLKENEILKLKWSVVEMIFGK